MKKFKFNINGSDYNVEILDTVDNVIHLEVNGTSYQVNMEKEIKTTKTPILVRAEVPPPTVKEQKIQKTPMKTSNITVKSPLPGTIISIDVKDGDEVKMGQKLLTMEAMKMANNVMAEKDGVIRSIKVKAGDAVLQGDTLMVIE
ncbi:MAG TPA: biotin/lipoyl-containing protein [Bacteroidales bacterium]|jgi:biotin carboxyl carrier protein|nr:biotin/lipoyl-containing protein [Bacteroidales bacterium]